MPKATIVSEIGDGEYVIQLEYDIARAVQLKERNELRIQTLIVTIATLQGIVNTRTAAKNTAADNLDTVISTEAAATPTGKELSDTSKKKINVANKALLDAIKALDEAETPLRSDQLLLVQYRKDIEEIEVALSIYENPVPVEAWCADHTLELEGEVGTLETSDETNNPQDQPTIIQPEGSIVDSKAVQPVISSGAMAIAYNLAAMPAFQKWQPVYRNGIISNINTVDNTADVSFSDTYEFSSVRGFKFNTAYSIFHDVKIEGIPVDYMDCHAEAFHENDKVVVKFTSTGVSRVGEVEPEFTGTVIGFVSNPFLCPINIYLESGFLDLLSTGRCTEAAYLPATLHFDADTASYNSSLTRPMQLKTNIIPSDLTEDSPYFGITPVEGQDSLAIGCLPSEKLSEITDFCLNTHTNGGYCGDVLGKKQAQQVIPSSMFSGKLRLFVQSLYGSIDSTYEKFNNFDLKISYPEEEDQEMYAPVTLVRGFQGSSILYTSENFDYFLFTYAGGQFTVFPLDLSQQGKNFRTHLLTSSRLGDVAYVKRVEALMLSTAKINTGNSAVLPILGPTILGSPLDYGWHANWKGDELACVVFFVDPLNPQYLSTVQKVKVTETINPVTGAVSFTIINTPESIDSPWWPWTNGLHVFLYDETLQSMIPVEYPTTLFGGFIGTFDSPLYCYYAFDELNGESELIICNIYMDIVDSKANISYIAPSHIYSWEEYVHQDVTTHPLNGKQGKKGFRIGVNEINVDVSSIDSTNITIMTPDGPPRAQSGFPNDTIWSDIYISGNDWGVNGNGLTLGQTKEIFFPTTGTTVTANWGWRANFLNYAFSNTTESGITETGSLIFQTILGSVDIVVTGVEESVSTGGGERKQNVGYPNTREYGGNLVWYLNSAFFGYPDLEIIAGPPPDHYLKGNKSIQTTPQEPLETWPASGPDYSTEIKSAKMSDVVEVQVTIDGQGNQEYFSPTISDKPTHTIDTGRHSIGNKYKIDHDAFNEDGDFIKDSSIGWS